MRRDSAAVTRRRPGSLVLVDALTALRGEASTWRLSPGEGAQRRADELEHIADELRGLLQRWH